MEYTIQELSRLSGATTRARRAFRKNLQSAPFSGIMEVCFNVRKERAL